MKKTGKILDKKNFHRIKTMNFPEMVRFITNIYEAGVTAGREATPGLNDQDVRKVLLAVPGIGEKRAEMIMNALNGKLDEEECLEYICQHCKRDLSQFKGVDFCPWCGSELYWEE